MSLLAHHIQTGRQIFEIAQIKQSLLNSSTDHILSFPAVPAEGSLMMAYILWGAAPTFNVTPTGWTRPVTQAATPTIEIWVKVAGPNEPNSYNWNTTTSIPGCTIDGFVFNGVHSTLPYTDYFVSTSSATNVVTITTPTVSANAKCFVLAGVACSGSGNPTMNLNNGFIDFFPGSFGTTGLLTQLAVGYKRIITNESLNCTFNWSSNARARTAIIQINPRV